MKENGLLFCGVQILQRVAITPNLASEHRLPLNTSQSHRDAYLRTLPERPYCTNRLGGRLHIRDRQRAAEYSMIQHNSPLVWHWMTFDIDSSDAFFHSEECGLPPPTFVALNRANGHGHVAYQLETPVLAFSSVGTKAMQFFADVERGMTRRLRADWAYPGFLSKNPLSDQWETAWMAAKPYRLDTLNDYLDPADKLRIDKGELSGVGRNIALFEAVRKVAYRQWLSVNKTGKMQGDFEIMLRDFADATNAAFRPPLSHAEVRGIARSITRWVWGKFSLAQFSAIQRARSEKRWSIKPTLTKVRPWESQGISRATWYRRQDSNPPIC